MTALFVRLMFTLETLAERTRARRDETGAAAVEYGLLVALIAAVIVTTVALLGPKIKDAFVAIVDALTGAGV
jgi:pilus assembly protein Flp/PilA